MPYEIAPTTSFTDEEHAQELLNELLEDGHDKDEMKGFIEIFGSKAFYENYEDYLRMIDQYDQETVDAFLNADFDIDDISKLEDAYYGQYDSEEEFAENFVNECYGSTRYAHLDRYRLGENMGRWTLMGLYILQRIRIL